MREIPTRTREQQRRASDPELSAWVSANAGSGKTHVLTQRVLRLLLAGAPPSRILCLTFTKAAAANMSTRVFRELARWAMLEDPDLVDAIVATGARRPDANQLDFARRLFARTIESPGGLKIQTLHAFCERLLHVFPFEANVAAGFRVIEDREARDLMLSARSATFARANADPDLAASLENVARLAGADGFDELLGATLKRRGDLAAFGDAEAYANALRARLGLAPNETDVALRVRMREGGGGPKRWREWAKALQTGAKTDKDRAALLIGAAATPDPELCLEIYRNIFFTQAGPPRKVLATKAVTDRFNEIVGQLYDERDRLEELADRLRAAVVVVRSRALAHVAEAVLARYAELKNARGWLDFDDLIARSAALLENADAAWVLYKLDAGIDHILVDEAQDTSRAQWDILRRLTSEFLDGEGARDSRRTFFAVGDEKQSIFSFQGAAPAMFDEMRRDYASRHERARLPFESLQLNLSFRSAQIVLDGVDRVFAVSEVWSGVSADPQAPPHIAYKTTLPGIVEVWPTVAPEPSPDPEDWRIPLDAASRRDPAVKLAERIAGVIKGWLAPSAPERLIDGKSGMPRRVGAGDVLILVRSRGALFEAMTRALRQAGIPSAGADRVTLRDHIAVMDLVAAGRAALCEDDDLSLAAALKSPLIGLDDDALLELAPGRPASLAAALAQSRFKEAQRRVSRWRERATLAPFDFYARLLGGDGGRRALLGRLGHEAADAIDEFMARALEYERSGPASLLNFLSEIEAADIAIKRDMEAEGDSVRVMTVHAAKGLEAPIVFLPDTCSAPSGRHDPKWLGLPPTRPGEPPLFVWATKKEDDSLALTEARAAAREAAAGEHRRLLYVAMTRAAQRLVICGFEGGRERPADCWYNLARLGLDPHLTRAPAPWSAAEHVARMGASAGDAGSLAPVKRAPPAAAPDWLWTLPEAESAPMSLAPSRRAAQPRNAAANSIRGERQKAGELAHVLLQSLPDIAPAQRQAAAQAFVARESGGLGPERRRELIARALDMVALPELAPLFGPGSRAEVPVAGVLSRAGRTAAPYSGRVDRLAVSAGVLYLADFKTGTPSRGGPPDEYVAQLALYRAALAPLYPGLEVRGCIAWLETVSVLWVSTAALDAALDRWIGEPRSILPP